jgi:2-C-methyl-D-erythritol 4-phosphate cytidylyltransferase
VAVPAGFEAEVERLLGEANPGHVERSAVVVGGASRAESIRAALEPVETEMVIVHDAARPLVTAALLDAVVATLNSCPDAAGAIAAAPLSDTVKLAREARPRGGGHRGGAPTIERTLSRDHLWAAQTPQAFRTGALREAQEGAAASGDLAAATDEATLLERAGGKVLICESPAENLKITTGLDLRLATALLGRHR